MPDTYDVYLDSVLTYTEEDAMLYAHEEQQYVLEPERSRWESTYLKDCESDDPNNCQVLCYKTYPAEVITFLVPKDTSLGNPGNLKSSVKFSPRRLTSSLPLFSPA